MGNATDIIPYPPREVWEDYIDVHVDAFPNTQLVMLTLTQNAGNLSGMLWLLVPDCVPIALVTFCGGLKNGIMWNLFILFEFTTKFQKRPRLGVKSSL